MNNLIIGTAGHVDHGKTMLVKALTGIETDRLKEEKERGISIELGFAFMRLPSGRQAGLVDVPGHERFIKNMLAGVGGIDMVLLIIAADEGIMPQTREHLDIIQLLQINKGIVVITKVDLVDEEWLGLIREEVRDYIKDTVMAEAPIIEVSAVTGHGIPELLQAVDQVAAETVEKPAVGKVRMPVDRTFTVTGFGTVVTGTLLSGILKIGDPVEIMPQGILSRVRSLQSHGKKTDKVLAGQRTAVNISGVELEQVPRGSVLTTPGSLTPSYKLDVRLLLLKSAPRSLKNRSRIRLYLGTAEILARVVLLDRDELSPGDITLAQLELEESAVAFKGDRFVLRSYSPMQTIGGGTVIDPVARKHKRFRDDVLEALSTREKGTPAELILQQLTNKPHPQTISELADSTDLEVNEIIESLPHLTEDGKIKEIKGDSQVFFVAHSVYVQWADDITNLVQTYHLEFPLREGFPKEELRSRKFAFINTKQFQLLLQTLEEDGLIKSIANSVSLPDFKPQPNNDQQKIINRLEHTLTEAGCQPPGWKELSVATDLPESQAQEILQYLLRQGTLIKIADDLYFHSSIIDKAKEILRQFFSQNNEISIGEVRDTLGTSRKYALPLMEYFDRERLTRRVGDKRMAGKALSL